MIANVCGQAETNGGGLALWGSDGSLGKIRTGDETYHQAWLPWITKIGRIIAANQITRGGVRNLPVSLSAGPPFPCFSGPLQSSCPAYGYTMKTY